MIDGVYIIGEFCNDDILYSYDVILYYNDVIVQWNQNSPTTM